MGKKAIILVDFDHTLFNTSKFADALSKSSENINYKDFLYPDYLEFINYASKFGSLTLFSEGEIKFQEKKINATEIGKLFPGGVKIFPSYAKMQDLSKNLNGEKIVLIDDKPDIVDEAVSLGCKVIRVKRGKYRSEKTKFRPDFEVDSLSEIVDKDLLRVLDFAPN